MNTQTQSNNIRGMNFADTSQNNEDDDLVFDPVVERKRIADGTEEYLEELRHDFAKYTAGKNSFPERISKISSALREWMLSYDRTKFYDQLAQELHLQGADRMGIAQVAWDIVLKSEWSPSVDFFQRYIGDVSAIPELVKRFSVEFIPQAQKLASVPDATSREITSNASGYGVVEEKKSIHAELSLMKALGKFEKLGGQQVTNSKIVVKGQNDPVRPTIFNWLRAYRDELGVGAHDAVTRGQFLFHSRNGKGLSADERDQVGMLLKSLDENMPLTIDVGRQEVVFQKQIPNTKYQIPNPPAVRQLADPIAEQPLPMQNGGNISRAVFELPHIMEQGTRNGEHRASSRQQIIENRQQITGSREQNTIQTAVAPLKSLPESLRESLRAGGTTAPANRPSAFEQAKAIRESARENTISLSKMDSETVELGKMDASAKGGQGSATGERSTSHPVASSRPSIAPTPQGVAPAPRAISFEPAKIDNFSFGAGDKGEEIPNTIRQLTDQIPNAQRPLPTRTEDFRPNFAPRDDMNVSAVSFSTNHVMPAEKEGISEQGAGSREQGVGSKEQGTGSKEQGIPNTIRQLADQVPNAERPLPIPTAGASIKNETIAPPEPVKKVPTTQPVNRFRITPTGHRDTVASDDTPSPHVVDLRG